MNTTAPVPDNACGAPARPAPYTTTPLPHPQLVLGSFQLLAWLFFRPHAWRAHLARIDPTLSPIFCLADLGRAQWRDPLLRRFLLQCHLPTLLLFTFAALAMVTSGAPAEDIAYELAAFVGGMLIYTLVIGTVLQSALLLPTCLGFLVAAAVGADGFLFSALSLGILGSVIGSTLDPAQTVSFTRRLGGLLLGSILGSLIAGLLLLLADIAGYALPQGLSRLGFGGAAGLLLGVALGWRTRAWRRSGLIGFGIVIGVIGLANILADDSRGLAGSIVDSLLLTGFVLAFQSTAFVISYRLVAWSADAWTALVAGLLAMAIADGATYAPYFNSAADWPTGLWYLWLFPIGLTLAWWRPVVLYPFQAAWNTLLYAADLRRSPNRPSLLRWHAAGWDELQRLPLAGLDEHLLLVLERHPSEGQAALDFLAQGPQRWAAQAAQIELDARLLERCGSVVAIGTAASQLAIGELAGPASALLRSFGRISQDVAAARRLVNPYHQRLALRAIEEQLDGLLRELTRSSERYARRFRPIATAWRQIIAAERERLAQLADQRQEIDNPYIVGVPLSAQQAVFVGRTDLSAQLETLLLERNCPPLLLYGQRRIGKTSLLNNLGRLLAQDIVPLAIDLQGPVTLAANHAGLLAGLAQAIRRAAQQERSITLPGLTRAELERDPFPGFDAWLDLVEQVLGPRTALLMLDEFEVLAAFLAEGHFDERAVLGMLRHIIQHRSRFRVLLAGSHTLEEVQRWAGYLINVQVIPISYLTAAETRQLVEQPAQDFPLRYTPEAGAQVFALTRGHPALIQLLCTAIIAAKNRQPPARRRLVEPEDIEAAVPEALQRGSMFFVDIAHNQIDQWGRAVLQHLAGAGAAAVIPGAVLAQLAPAEGAQCIGQLLRRELIEAVPGGYRFQVELVRRWFAQSDVRPINAVQVGG